MRREPPVRFCEGLGVKFPRATRLVIGAARGDDARRIMEVLHKRMSMYGLTVHPEKTRLVRFQPPRAASSETEERDPPGPKTFDFLGFTHYWGRSRNGVWVVKRKTAKQPAQACVKSADGMVSQKYAPSDQGAAPEAHAKAARPLWVLRDHWKLLQPPGIPGDCARDLETPVVSATPKPTHGVVSVRSAGGALQSSPRPRGPRPGEWRSDIR